MKEKMDKKNVRAIIFALVVIVTTTAVSEHGVVNLQWLIATLAIIFTGDGYAVSKTRKKLMSIVFMLVTTVAIIVISPFNSIDWQFWVALLVIVGSGFKYANTKTTTT